MREYTTERGVTVQVVPIPLLLDEIRKANAGPSHPTYTEKIAGGGTQEVEITEADAMAWQQNDPDTWAEHAETWDAYVKERDEAQEKLNDRVWQAIMRKALVFDMPADDSWIAEHEALGLTIPKGKADRRVYYIRTEVIGGMRDVLKITAIANGADMSEEALQLAEDSFRGSLARSILTGIAGARRGVEPGPAGGADSDGEGMGAQAE